MTNSSSFLSSASVDFGAINFPVHEDFAAEAAPALSFFKTQQPPRVHGVCQNNHKQSFIGARDFMLTGMQLQVTFLIVQTGESCLHYFGIYIIVCQWTTNSEHSRGKQ